MMRFDLFAPRVASAALAIAVGLTAGGSRAATDMAANITHDQESTASSPLLTSTGAPRPLSYGTGSFVINDAQTAMSFTATIYNIDVTGAQTPDTNDNLVAAHIHGAAPPGQNAGVRWGFFGAPFNDNNPNNFVLTPFATGVGGTFSGVWDAPEGNNTTLADQLPNILAGLTYINFHTTQFGGGEIRGQILPAAAVPEPGTLALLGVALPGLLALRRRRA